LEKACREFVGELERNLQFWEKVYQMGSGFSSPRVDQSGLVNDPPAILALAALAQVFIVCFSGNSRKTHYKNQKGPRSGPGLREKRIIHKPW